MTLQLFGYANNWVTRCGVPSGTVMSACTTALKVSAARVKDNLVSLNMDGSLSAKARLRGVNAHPHTVAVDREKRVEKLRACRF